MRNAAATKAANVIIASEVINMADAAQVTTSIEIPNKSMQADIFERLAVFQAIYRAVCEEVATKTPGNLRDYADKTLYDMYDHMGINSVKLKVFDRPVGNFAITFDKERADIRDHAQFDDWCLSNGCGHLVYELDRELIPDDELEELKVTHPEWFTTFVVVDRDVLEDMKRAPDGSIYYGPTGEAVPGLKWMNERPKWTAITNFKPQVVFESLASAGLTAGDIIGLLAAEVD